MDKLRGTMGTLSSMQLTADMKGLDAQSKTILRSAEVLAVILRETVTEYKGYSRKEVMDFIEKDSITDTKEVSQGRTNTQIRSDNAEFVQLNEKTSLFDLAFRARNPLLSTESMQISLHVDIESQKTYKPGYPIEKRGLYHLARRLSSQLMTLVVIKLGNTVYNGKKEDEGYDLLRFLNAIMYPHRGDFMATISDYIDFSENEELWKEENIMDGLGECIYNEGREDARDDAIRSVLLDYIDDQLPMDRILAKLQKVFGLTEEMSHQYYQKYSSKA